jgi:anti-sigma regulatory factor (Ser/Thr protein kinase)
MLTHPAACVDKQEGGLKKNSGDEIRQYILAHVQEHPDDIAKVAAEAFGITRQAVHRHLSILVKENQIEAAGQTRRKRYMLKVHKVEEVLALAENRDEDRVWRSLVEPILADLPENVLKICQYSFTEMFNNAIEHSEGEYAKVRIERTARFVKLIVMDNGIGIFAKIKSALGLEDYRHAILELAKGKLTTDPKHHTGEGIFFVSRMFDEFGIVADKYQFLHTNRLESDWLIEDREMEGPGTMIHMTISVDSPRTLKSVFDHFTNPEADDYGFSKTHVPLRLAQYGQDHLVSRSQARRVLARFERFKVVFLDFSGIESIGQAFADEIFRVYAADHPEIKLVAHNANEQVSQMIGRALAAAKSSER